MFMYAQVFIPFAVNHDDDSLRDHQWLLSASHVQGLGSDSHNCYDINESTENCEVLIWEEFSVSQWETPSKFYVM